MHWRTNKKPRQSMPSGWSNYCLTGTPLMSLLTPAVDLLTAILSLVSALCWSNRDLQRSFVISLLDDKNLENQYKNRTKEGRMYLNILLVKWLKKNIANKLFLVVANRISPRSIPKDRSFSISSSDMSSFSSTWGSKKESTTVPLVVISYECKAALLYTGK